jgi:hypothetical protein
VRPGVAGGHREGYAAAVTGLWRRLARALSELEAIAADPDELYEFDILERLPRLQYALHAAAELALGLRPPPGAEAAHAELGESLAAARDATGELVEVVEVSGPEAAEGLVPEWRGALFRVRLARMRATTPPPLPVQDVDEDRPVHGNPLAGTLLAIGGAVLFAAGATIASWPVWSIGIALFAGGFLVFRPRP